MVESNNVAKVASLTEQLKQHNALYAMGQPVIADTEYDALFRELEQLEAAHPELRFKDSPTQKVGFVGDKSGKVKHLTPMLSLENAFSAEELFDSFTSNMHSMTVKPVSMEVLFQAKVDGLALTTWWKAGKLIKAVTRGDHEVGDDVTDNVRRLATVPVSLVSTPTNQIFEIRGEVYMPRQQLAKLNTALTEAGQPTFANARNAAAGSLKLSDADESAKRGLKFMAYQVVIPEGKVPTWSADFEALQWLQMNGFETARWSDPTPISFDTRVAGIAELQKLIDDFASVRKSLDFDTDGMVAKINNNLTRKVLGCKTRCPRWAIAYKYPAEKVPSVVLGITLQVGKRGTITPVAELEPVTISGSVIRRATLHNQDFINLHNIDIGDTVLVEKRGEVIPAIAGLVRKGA